MKEPAQVACYVEKHPQLPAGVQRVAGFGVMGLPFRSSHVLGRWRWTASSVGPGFTSNLASRPSRPLDFLRVGRSGDCLYPVLRCGGRRVRVGPIALDWEDSNVAYASAHWTTWRWTGPSGSEPAWVTRTMSRLGSALPASVWRWRPVLSVMGRVAGPALGVGKVQLTGLTANGNSRPVPCGFGT